MCDKIQCNCQKSTRCKFQHCTSSSVISANSGAITRKTFRTSMIKPLLMPWWFRLSSCPWCQCLSWLQSCIATVLVFFCFDGFCFGDDFPQFTTVQHNPEWQDTVLQFLLMSHSTGGCRNESNASCRKSPLPLVFKTFIVCPPMSYIPYADAKQTGTLMEWHPKCGTYARNTYSRIAILTGGSAQNEQGFPDGCIRTEHTCNTMSVPPYLHPPFKFTNLHPTSTSGCAPRRNSRMVRSLYWDLGGVLSVRS